VEEEGTHEGTEPETEDVEGHRLKDDPERHKDRARARHAGRHKDRAKSEEPDVEAHRHQAGRTAADRTAADKTSADRTSHDRNAGM
jgi:hypothetical protein